MFGIGAFKQRLPRPEDALPGRAQAIVPRHPHQVLGGPLDPAAYPGSWQIVFGMGCFWGAERAFWSLPGVLTTAVGYAGGFTPNPSYREVCSGQTGHAEVVRVVYDPTRIELDALLRTFWERHDPTQGMRQGNDVGTQYRSAVYVGDADALERVRASAQRYALALGRAGHTAPLSTEIAPAGPFYYAEDEHQQYLAKHPDGYCGLGGTGVSCPVGLGLG